MRSPAESLQAAVRSLPAPIRSGIRRTPFFGVYSALRYLLIPKDNLTVPTPTGDLSLTVPTDAYLKKLVIENGTYEPNLTKALSEVVDESTVFYDIGSR